MLDDIVASTLSNMNSNHDEYVDKVIDITEADNSGLKSVILNEKRRIDWLMSEVLGYAVECCHRSMLRLQEKNKKALVLAPRGIGKSTALTIVRCIYEVLENPDIRVLIVSNTQLQAEIFLREIKQHLESNEKLIEIFGYQVGSKWDSKEINVKNRKSFAKESNVSCCGVGGAIIGRHYDLILGDDLVDEENSRTELQRERFRIWFYKALDPTLEPDGRIFIHGTRYYPSDHYGYLIKHDDYAYRVWPALKEINGVVGTLWPEKMSISWLNKKKKSMGSAIFSTQYQNDVSLMEGKIFNYSDFQFYKILPEGLKIFQGVDLAISEKETADYFVVCTIGKDQYNNIFIIDIYEKRLSFPKQTKMIEQKFNQFKPMRVFIEANNYQKSQTQQILATTDVRAKPVLTIKDKVTRAWHLAHKFEAGQMFFPEFGAQGLIDQLLAFPDVDHDDMFDALEIAVTSSGRKQKKDRKEPGLL